MLHMVECKTFVQQLLEPNVEQRMKIEEAARHRWVKRPGMRMRVHPLLPLEPKANREVIINTVLYEYIHKGSLSIVALNIFSQIYRQISELCGQPVTDVIAQIKAEPFGTVAGMYNIKTHLQQIQNAPGLDLLWTTNVQETRPASPPEYKTTYDLRQDSTPSSSKAVPPTSNGMPQRKMVFTPSAQKVRIQNGVLAPKPQQIEPPPIPNESRMNGTQTRGSSAATPHLMKDSLNTPQPKMAMPFKTSETQIDQAKNIRNVMVKPRNQSLESPRLCMMNRPMSGSFSMKKPMYKVYDSGDCGLDPRLPSIDEHSNTDLDEKQIAKNKTRTSFMRKVNLDDDRRLSSCPNRMGDGKRPDFYRRGSDTLTK